jgi:hypothetical protein
MKIAANELPWKNAQDAVACNLALGHLFANLPRQLTINGRLHAETYISAVGAIAGYAAQRTLFARSQPATLMRMAAASGEQYWFGDALNEMLAPATEADANRCVWSLAGGGATVAGLQPERMPKLEAMFKYVASTIGGANEGKSSVPAEHQAQLTARDLLKTVWPTAVMCFSGKFPSVNREFGAAPIAWWSAIAAQASSRPVQDVKGVLPPRYRPDIADGARDLLQQARPVAGRDGLDSAMRCRARIEITHCPPARGMQL